MKYAIIAALFLAGCANQADIASAAAIPAYLATAQTALDRNATKPMNAEQIAVLKAADQKAFEAIVGINAEQMRRATELHRIIQGL